MILVVKLFFFIFFIVSCQKSSPYHVIEGNTMGTSYTIKYLKNNDIKFLKKKIDRSLKDINAHMSSYIKNSEISLLNKAKAHRWHKVSPEIFELLSISRELWKKTEKSYDITIGPLVNLWGFGPLDVDRSKIPTDTMIQTAMLRSGFHLIKLKIPHYLWKEKDDVILDLSSLAKGYAVDVIARLLLQEKISSFMIEIGGEVKVHGNKEGRGWTIGISSPLAESKISKILRLKNISLATSGDYRNFLKIDQKKFSHIIDINTGYSVKDPLTSVTVLSLISCTLADAWATALMSAGHIRGLKIAKKYHIAALFLIKNGSNLVVKETEKFQQFLQ